jgi:pimeloyl-ACP methyl ester carboxylesterase
VPSKAGRMVLVAFAALLLTLLPALAACANEPATGSTGGTSGGIQGKQVTFKTSDGVLLSGHLFGSGTSGIVLSHMYPADQKSWYPTAKKLAASGYLVLTYDFRGYGASAGNKQIEYIDRDVLAAVKKISEAGATDLVLIGASMGGTASLMVAAWLFAGQLSPAEAPSVRTTIAGVATLSAPVTFMGLSAEKSVPGIYCPLLFVAAKGDAGAEGALELEHLSSNAGDMEIVPGDEHGTALLEGGQASKVYNLLLEFLKKNLPVTQP